MSSLSCIIKDMAKKGGRQKGKKGLSAKHQLEKFTTNLPQGLYLWLKWFSDNEGKTMSLVITEFINELLYKKAIDFLRGKGVEIDKDILVLIVLYIKNNLFPVGFIAGKDGKVKYFPFSDMNTLEKDLIKEFGQCKLIYVLLTSNTEASKWNNIGGRICENSPVVLMWDKFYPNRI